MLFAASTSSTSLTRADTELKVDFDGEPEDAGPASSAVTGKPSPARKALVAAHDEAGHERHGHHDDEAERAGEMPVALELLAGFRHGLFVAVLHAPSRPSAPLHLQIATHGQRRPDKADDQARDHERRIDHQ